MVKYVCIKSSILETTDEDGFYHDDVMNIEEGEIWELDEDSDRLLRWETPTSYTWIEVDEDILEGHFRKLN